MKINSIDKSMKSVLQSNYYRIPRFQRPYSWTQENVADFWNDTIVDVEADYFIGSIVVFDSGNDTFGIVDGQQRLSTITMILCALRNAFESEGHKGLAQAIHQLIERPDINDKLRYVISPETSFPFFQEYVQKWGNPELNFKIGEEEKAIQSAFTQIGQFITDTINSVKNDPSLTDEAKKKNILDKMASIRDKLLNLKVIFIQLDNEDDAYSIFETLNTRGKDLNVADLVKAHLVRLLPVKNVDCDTPKIKWAKLVETIEGSSADLDVPVFLHHYWLSKYNYTTIKKLFKEIRKRIKKANAPEFLNELVIDAETYRGIHEVSYAKWNIEENQIKDSLDAFSIFRIRQQVPMVLSIMRDYKSHQLKKKEVEEILGAIEKFHFIFTAVTSQRSSGGISQMYASAARELAAKTGRADKLAVLNELKDKLKKKLPSFDEFLIDFRDIKYSNDYTKQKKLVKYILCRIHQYYNNGVTADYDRMTIEHISPQNKSEACLPLVDEMHVAQLGNLILVPEKLNCALGNKSFEEKKRILNENNVILDPAVMSETEWGNSQIDTRTDWLATVIYKQLWKI